MRARVFVAVGLLALPSVLTAQIRVTRPGRTPEQPTTLPPEIPPVARSLSIQRSRWTAEAYTMFSAVQVPTGNGVSSYTTFGAGTRADYRFTDRWSATMDLTASALGSPAVTETAEAGTRFSPMTWSEDYRGIRPYFDVRAAYMHSYDTFASPAAVVSGQAGGQNLETGRYSRGFGGVFGTGADLPITSRWAISTEISGLRNRMSTYRLTNVSSLPINNSYWMTTFRFAVGIKYNAIRSLSLSQNPMK